ncbi:hypothetical protein WSK_2763 [Novosphingobium sp. Rr 2-17]|uniref:flagellar assembly protein FliX n=1 Tax=Novosphingobium sp. Rr 2-17 TaxID=555793 RepID=UPI0002699221|nr:flagellar assembly protein FliX [Novosphingobium sp. Rr 2-17]EIZ78715.1 hypothetical protein WSK_2763 [Novosphingobium sp. Rr 2-17]
MRITGLTASLQNLLLATQPKVAAFAVAEPRVQDAAPVTPLAQPVSVEMLVTLAATELPIDRRRRAANQADRGLRALERLDAEQAAGLPAVERLQEVAAWSETLETPQDPVLAALLQEIELRVRVELAKHNIIA